MSDEKYSYYHLLSGLDLPLKNQDYIHNFFEKNNGKEFIAFDEKANKSKDFLLRVNYYYFFQEKIGRNRGKLVAFFWKIQELFLKIQKKFKISRLRNSKIRMYKGTQWFSITDGMVNYILSYSSEIYKSFRFSLAADEVFLHSVAMESPYKDNIVNNSLREIDWTRGNPYTFHENDIEYLRKSSALYARKFDENVDSKVIKQVIKFSVPK